MAFCAKCGAEIQANARNCQMCGAPVEAAQSAGDFTNKFQNLNNTSDTTGQYDAMDIEANKTMCIFAYIGFLFIIPLAALPQSRFARFHSNQGIVLFIAEVVYSIVASILTTVFAFIPVIGWLLATIIWMVNIVFLVLAIVGIVNACSGKAKDLPIIGKIRILK